MKRGLLIALMCTISASASAQRQVVVGHVGFEAVPASQVDDDSGVTVSRTSLALDGLLPIPVSPETTVIVAPRYRVWRFASDEVQDRTLHDLGTLVAVRQRLTERWTMSGAAGLGLASDFDAVKADHLRITGALSGEYTFSPRLRLGLGAAASYNFGKLLPLPVVIAFWMPSDTIEVLVRLPQRAQVNYWFSTRFQAGIGVSLDGNRFSVGSPIGVESLSVSAALLEVRLAARIVGGTWVAAYGGTTLFRRFEAFDNDGSRLIDLSLNRAFFAGIAFEWRVDATRRETPPAEDSTIGTKPPSNTL